MSIKISCWEAALIGYYRSGADTVTICRIANCSYLKVIEVISKYLNEDNMVAQTELKVNGVPVTHTYKDGIFSLTDKTTKE